MVPYRINSSLIQESDHRILLQRFWKIFLTNPPERDIFGVLLQGMKKLVNFSRVEKFVKRGFWKVLEDSAVAPFLKGAASRDFPSNA